MANVDPSQHAAPAPPGRSNVDPSQRAAPAPPGRPRNRPAPMSGFPELLPGQQMVTTQIVDGLRRIFELHGFAPIETRAVEPVERLTGGTDVDKEIYAVRRLAEPNDGDVEAGLGLHFDLTVPFARYVLENAGKLDFPFRRYQIQKVWRGERPQSGRYREFTQADIDIVAKDSLAFHHDIEVARVMAEALAGLPVGPFRLQINNRKVLQGFLLGIGAPDPAAAMRAIDRMDRVPASVVGELLRTEATLTDRQAQLCLELAAIRTPDNSFVDRVRVLGVHDQLLDEGLAELGAVIEGCADLNSERITVEADLRIARGLDYYTGTVFETRLTGYDALGSICSGGRYDSLASHGRTTYPGVGISLGLSRLLVPLFADGTLAPSRSVPSTVLIALADEDSRAVSTLVAQALRARGIASEVAAAADKYGRQIRFAQRRDIPYVWFPATEVAAADEVKDIRSGGQVPADPKTWWPPEADLTAQIITTPKTTE
ncbi:MAG: histidine--tRNA ligase [Geodermatophilaceae bacterium]|nr:histidine--tRNA ligase [Geodermatophilaceae bacterium]